ncbi:hypothetical protein [Nocardioides sp.]|uniref:hypothetical protein n=1 Tax=Nocardioides sp. TaxID=35761 RepID=UPI003D0E959C
MRNLAIVAASVLLLAGCGSSTDSDVAADPTEPASSASSPTQSPSTEPSDSPTVKPATGAQLDAVAFSLTVPKGWADINEGDDKAVVLYAADLRENGDTPDMVTVRRGAATGSVAAATARGAALLKAGGATKVKAMAPVEVCGTEVAHVRAIKTAPGVHTMLNQYSLTAQGHTWLITFSTNQWQVEADRARLLDSVLSTCTLAS